MKAPVLGSKKPYKQPGVLGPKDKVSSEGPLLGAKKEKKNPTLSKKFFGTCSRDNDPGIKSVLGESVNELAKLAGLSPVGKYDAAIILPGGQVLLGEYHYDLIQVAREVYKWRDESGDGGTIKIRAANSEGNQLADFRFTNSDEKIVRQIEEAMSYIKSPGNIFQVGFYGAIPHFANGTPAQLHEKFEQWFGTTAPVMGRSTAYWHENKINQKNALVEYKKAIANYARLSKLNQDMGAALILCNDKILMGMWHWSLRKEAAELGLEEESSLYRGAVRVRFRGSCDGFSEATQIEFGNKDQSTISRVEGVIANVDTPKDIFELLYSCSPYWKTRGTSSEVVEALENFANPAPVIPSSSMAYWYTNENKNLVRHLIVEGVVVKGGLDALQDLSIENGAALVTANNQAYIGRFHDQIRPYAAREIGVSPCLLKNGALRIRYAGSLSNFKSKETEIEFANDSEETIERIRKAMAEISTYQDRFRIEHEWPNYWHIEGTSSEINLRLNELSRSRMKLSNAVSYWHEDEENNDPALLEYTNIDSKQLRKLSLLQPGTGAAIITNQNHVFVGDFHMNLGSEIKRAGENPQFNSGAIEIRFAGTEGFSTNDIRFGKKDSATILRVEAAIDNLSSDADFELEFIGSVADRYWSCIGSADQVIKKLHTWLNSNQAPLTRSVGFWHEDVLDEAAGANQFWKLEKLSSEMGAALITPDNKVYIGRMHWELRDKLHKEHNNFAFANGTVRVRYAGTAGFHNTCLEFLIKDDATINRVKQALNVINTPRNIFVIEYTNANDPYWFATGTPEELIQKLDHWLEFDKPQMSQTMAYWRTESKAQKDAHELTEAFEKFQ